MSAWVVERAHIDVIVQGLAESEVVVTVDPDELGRILWTENVLSVDYCYSEASGRSEMDSYVYRRPSIKQSLSSLKSALDCYVYQSCEHPRWADSDARRGVLELTERLVAAGVRDDVEGTPWGYSESDVHVATAVSA